MALATVCPHCNTTFRVASDQLKLRGGIVRCGACNEVFDGNAALIDLDAAAQAPGEAAPALAPAPIPELIPEPEEANEEAPSGQLDTDAAPEQSASAAFDAEVAAIEAIEAQQAAAASEPVYTLDFDTTFDPFGILPKPAQPEPEPAPEPEPEPEPEPDPEPASLLMRESAAAEPLPAAAPESQAAAPRQGRRNKRKRAKPAPELAVEVEVAPEPEPEPDSDEPEFVRRSRLQEQTGRTRRILMGVGSALLVLALAAQGVATFRNVLAARFPQFKPVLASTCAVLGCRVDLPAQIETLSVETGELQSLGANAFSYTTLLRNQGGLVQAWPDIELALTDANDKPLVRRVFTPAEYLPQGVAPAKGFGARSEQPVKLFFELNQVKASGYHIAIFYP